MEYSLLYNEACKLTRNKQWLDILDKRLNKRSNLLSLEKNVITTGTYILDECMLSVQWLSLETLEVP